jgi:endoglucanase
MKKAVMIFTAVISLLLFSCKATENRQTGSQPPVSQLNIPLGNPEDIPKNPATDFVKSMEIGINIGNTLDAIGTNTWHAGETGWGNPRITREFIRALKNYGYKTIRLPVTWAEYMGAAPGFIIEEERMGRVEEVVNWILAEDMYCILNIHHDGGESDKSWILAAADEPDRVAGQFAAVWGQIARRFLTASPEKLVFESMNEVGFDKLWNRYNRSSSGKAEAYRILNLLNQTFVDTVRAAGSANARRFLLIAGYWTDIELTCDPLFTMPRDTIADRLIVSVHYYTPATFCIAEERNNSWGFRESWGTLTDITELGGQFQMLRTNFVNKGIPVILGEYGVTLKNKVEDSRIKWMSAVTQISLSHGICPVLWDTGGEIKRNPPYEMRDSLRQIWAAVGNR